MAKAVYKQCQQRGQRRIAVFTSDALFVAQHLRLGAPIWNGSNEILSNNMLDMREHIAVLEAL